ncbi:hypothetical protein [Pyrobaculum islandicum]|uniref:hypothetical protein n=1 Tax=Pyrobaculum islandicum TaxID=2277 RepID=UPI001432ABDB|nr:hypothetical protein [Pyrobaculum islandicum]
MTTALEDIETDLYVFILGGFDWIVWKQTRFMYGGAMSIPAEKRKEATEASRVVQLMIWLLPQWQTMSKFYPIWRLWNRRGCLGILYQIGDSG